MTDKRKLAAIKAEIIRLVAVRGHYKDITNDILTFIHSLPDEPICDDFSTAKTLSEEKMKSYLQYCENKGKVYALCHNCKQAVEVDIHPYYYDEEENDVYFASLCPQCGELIITKG